MLVYQPAFDMYNCIFRMMQLLNYTQEDVIAFDKLRIWDFYLTFPSQVRHISFPQDLRKLKEKVFKGNHNPYEDVNDPKLVFERMKPYQLSAIKAIASYGFIESAPLNEGIVKKTDKTFPVELTQQFTGTSIEKTNVIKLVVNDFVDLSLFGNGGLKARTGLIDFRYDPKQPIPIS